MNFFSRFVTELYSTCDGDIDNMFIHLTNYSINKGSLKLSELREVREDSFVKADMEEEAAKPAHPHPEWVICPRLLC